MGKVVSKFVDVAISPITLTAAYLVDKDVGNFLSGLTYTAVGIAVGSPHLTSPAPLMEHNIIRPHGRRRTPLQKNAMPRRGVGHRGRWSVGMASGDCMAPAVNDTDWVLVDRDAGIRQDDIVLFKSAEWGSPALKRFIGWDTEKKLLHFSTLNPDEPFTIHWDGIEWLYRARATAVTRRGIFRAVLRCLLNPSACQERLAGCGLMAGRSGRADCEFGLGAAPR